MGESESCIKLILKNFDNTEAMEFIKEALKIANNLQNEDISNLAQRLHNSPLILQLAVTYIKEEDEKLKNIDPEWKFDVNDYLSEYETKTIELLNSEALQEIGNDYFKTTFIALQLILDKIKINHKKCGQQALEIINIMAYVAQDGIPAKIFLELVNDANKLGSVIHLLKQYSIVRQETGLTMHESLQQLIRLELKKQQEEGKSSEENTLRKALLLLKTHMVDCDSADSYAPHVISIWNYAMQYNDLIKDFIVNSIESNATYTTYFHLITRSNNYKVFDTIFKKIEQNYPDELSKVINAENQDKEMPLHNAALNGDERIIKVLIEKGANVDAENKHGWTPLHLASKNGNLEIVKVLLVKGANVNSETKDKFTSLHFAALNVRLEIVKALLNEMANVDIKTTEGNTALNLAVKKTYLHIVRTLLEKGASVNVQDKEYFTPLHWAALNDNTEFVNELLKDSKIVINAQTTKGDTPLHLAAENDHFKVIETLITNIADVDVRNKEGKTASDVAHDKNHLKVKNYIIQHQDKHINQSNHVQQSTFNRRKGTAGISGQLYEIELSMLCQLHGTINKRIDNFHLATNMEEAGDFDDVVFKYKYKDYEWEKKTKLIFLQAKHREKAKKEISLETLLAETDKGDFLLKKYFTSYREIKQQFSEKNKDHPIFGCNFKDSNFIIYTNALFTYGKSEEANIKKIDVEKESAFKLKEENNHYYQLTFGGNKEKKIIHTLTYSSDCKKLAKELAEYVSSKKVIDINKPIFGKYHISLAERVIEAIKLKEGIFRKSFLDGDESLSLEDKKFREAFFEEIQKMKEFKGKSISELESELSDKSIKLHEKFGDIQKIDPKLPLPSDLVNEDEIKEFLNKLKLFVDQPNQSELNKIVKQKIQSLYSLEHENVDLIYCDVQNKVQKWWKEENKYLTEKNKLFEDAKQNLSKLRLTGLAVLRSGQIEKLELTFKNDEVENLIQLIRNKQILNIVTDKSTALLSSAKVYQSLESMIEYKSIKYDYRYIFMSLGSVLNLQNKVIDTFKSEKSNLLVIECEFTEGNIMELYQELSTVIRSNDNKKLILVTQEDDTFANKFKDDFSEANRYEEKMDKNKSLVDLTYESQKKTTC